MYQKFLKNFYKDGPDIYLNETGINGAEGRNGLIMSGCRYIYTQRLPIFTRLYF
jgi:hypothetical protein